MLNDNKIDFKKHLNMNIKGDNKIDFNIKCKKSMFVHLEF